MPEINETAAAREQAVAEATAHAEQMDRAYEAGYRPATGVARAIVVPPAINVDDYSPQLTTSPTIGKLAVALAKAQDEIVQPRKSDDNPFFKSKYAGLDTVWEAARKVLSKHGIAVFQSAGFQISDLKGRTMGLITVSTTVVHGETGEWITNVLRVTSENVGPQAIGSAVTYARRYSIQPLLMLTPEGDDDDANKAEGKGAAQEEDRPSPEEVADVTKRVKDAADVPALEAVWNGIPEAHRKVFNKLVGARKKALEKAAPPAEKPPAEQTTDTASDAAE